MPYGPKAACQLPKYTHTLKLTLITDSAHVPPPKLPSFPSSRNCSICRATITFYFHSTCLGQEVRQYEQPHSVLLWPKCIPESPTSPTTTSLKCQLFYKGDRFSSPHPIKNLVGFRDVVLSEYSSGSGGVPSP